VRVLSIMVILAGALAGPGVLTGAGLSRSRPAIDAVPGKDPFPALVRGPNVAGTGAWTGPWIAPGKTPWTGAPTLRDLPSREGGRAYRPLANWPPAETDPPADMLHLDLDVTFDLPAHTVSGTATLTVLWGTAPDNTLRLDLRDLAVTAVRRAGGMPLGFTRTDSTLEIAVVPPPSPGDTVTVAVDYGGDPTRGFYVYSTAAYTFTEPNGSRYWFPCRDVPWDKATLALHGHVPSTRMLVGNGVLDSVTVGLPGESVYHWREDHPLATYLMAAAISDYAEVHVPSAVTPLTWYVYPSHVAAAESTFQHLDAMIAFYDSTLVPYPFDKYAMCEANFGGGMEHQSATLMGESIVTAGVGDESIAAHELAHQWFGDLVTTDGWSHVWLNEGFATFYEAAWQEAFYGPARFAERMQADEDEVTWWMTNRLDVPVVDPPAAGLFNGLVYYKAAWALRMLRDLVGKSAFDLAVRDYLTAHAFGNATTDDFRAAVEARYGQALDWFFDQWLVTGTGKPEVIYMPRFDPVASGWRVQVAVRQVQASPTVFRFPVDVRVTTTAGTVDAVRWVEAADQALAVEVADPPLAVALDPDNKLLGDFTEGVVTSAGGLAPPPPILRAWPNPFVRALRVDPGAGAERVVILDVQGRTVRELLAGGRWIWDGRDAAGRAAAPGAYFLRVPGERRGLRVVKLER